MTALRRAASALLGHRRQDIRGADQVQGQALSLLFDLLRSAGRRAEVATAAAMDEGLRAADGFGTARCMSVQDSTATALKPVRRLPGDGDVITSPLASAVRERQRPGQAILPLGLRLIGWSMACAFLRRDDHRFTGQGRRGEHPRAASRMTAVPTCARIHGRPDASRPDSGPTV